MSIRLHFLSLLILCSAFIGCLPQLATPKELSSTPASSPSITQPPAPVPGIQQQLADNAILLYARGNALHAWPELAIFQQPPFLSLYPDSLGYYGEDLAPRQWGRYLLIPGLKRSPNTSPTANDATTWLVDLQTNQVKEVGHEPLHALWSPTNPQFVYVKNETVYVEDAGHPGGATAIFSEPGLNDFFIAWSPDGTQLAVINHQIGDSSAGEYPQITDSLKIISASGEETETLGTFSIVPIQHSRQALQWSADGRALSLAMTWPNLIFPLDDKVITLDEGITILSWLPHRPNHLLVKNNAAELFIIDAYSQEIISQISEDTRNLTAWSFSPDGRYLALAYEKIGGNSVELFIYDEETGKIQREGTIEADIITTLIWVPQEGTHPGILVLDDGNSATPIWGLDPSAGQTAEVLIEAGILLNVLPSPPK